MLKTVLMPSSFLMVPTYFIDKWYLCANRKQMPGSPSRRTAFSGPWSREIPNASRTSAAPLLEEAARLPCLETFTPDDAMTIEDAVEMLKLLEPSPPVPTISSVSYGLSTRSARSRIAAALPAISSMVSALVLLVESAARYAAFCTGEVTPDMISVMTW